MPKRCLFIPTSNSFSLSTHMRGSIPLDQETGERQAVCFLKPIRHVAKAAEPIGAGEFAGLVLGIRFAWRMAGPQFAPVKHVHVSVKLDGRQMAANRFGTLTAGGGTHAGIGLSLVAR